MADPPKRMKGSGRVAFFAQQAEIAAELAAGWPVKASYLSRADRLGISYNHFTRYVARYIGKPTRPQAPGSTQRATPAAPSPEIIAPNPPPPSSGEAPIHARHEPAGRPTFHHSGVTEEGELERLLGPNFLPKRGR